jgi:hypothetical protein
MLTIPYRVFYRVRTSESFWYAPYISCLHQAQRVRKKAISWSNYPQSEYRSTDNSRLSMGFPFSGKRIVTTTSSFCREFANSAHKSSSDFCCTKSDLYLNIGTWWCSTKRNVFLEQLTVDAPRASCAKFDILTPISWQQLKWLSITRASKGLQFHDIFFFLPLTLTLTFIVCSHIYSSSIVIFSCIRSWFLWETSSLRFGWRRLR